jgi:hypothetical protein
MNMAPRAAPLAIAKTLLLVAAPALVMLSNSPARAEAQGTAGMTIGAAGAGVNRKIWDKTVFHVGLRADVLFGRNRSTDFGLGPYVELFTHALDEVQFGGGVSGLLPIVDPFPLVLSVGAYGRKGDDAYGVEPGVAAELFWGTRSFNFHSNYVMAAGIMAQMRYGLGPSKETSIVIGAQLDFAALGLPLVFLINAVRGGSKDTAPVR